MKSASSRQFNDLSNISSASTSPNEELLKGRIIFENLPPVRPRTIRVYLCAPYDDTIDEVNHLVKNVFPVLREFSMSRYGIEFQVVDLHWGADRSQIVNRELFQECQTEIEKCKQQSIGMTFLCLINEIYGTFMLPLWFERNRFDIILNCLTKNKIDCDGLKHFYKLNINNMENRYELENHEDLTNEVEKELIDLLNTGFKFAIQEKLLSESDSEFRKVNQSILQKIVNIGAFQTPQKEDRVFSYVKIPKNGEGVLEASSKATEGTVLKLDLKNSEINPELLKNLLDKEVNYYVPVEQIYRIKIDRIERESKNKSGTKASKISELNPAYVKYLENFGEHYRRMFEKLIDKFIQKSPENLVSPTISKADNNNGEKVYGFHFQIALNDTLYAYNYIKENRLNQNLEFNLNQNYKAIIQKLMNYIYDKDEQLSSVAKVNKPFILYGKLGTGKTSYMATLASTLYFQLKLNDKYPEHFLLIRFIGIDGKTTNLRNLLKSLCIHLNVLYKRHTAIPNKLNELKAYFKRFLTSNDFDNAENNCHNTKLVILLDSLQDLTNHDNTYKLDWLPVNLKKNCKLILSIASEPKELFTKLRIKYNFINMEEHSDHFLQLDNYLNFENSEFILKKFHDVKNYRLQDEQLSYVLKLLTKNNQHRAVTSRSRHQKNEGQQVTYFLLKLLSKELLMAKSYTDLAQNYYFQRLFNRGNFEINSFLSNFIECIEEKFGKLPVKHVLSYIAISQDGFSEMELQDILSLDNVLLSDFKAKGSMLREQDFYEVLDDSSDTKQKRTFVRMPWLYILRILNYLDDYLIRRPFQGVYTIYWRHKIFSNIVKNKYLENDKDFQLYLHKNVAEYFLGLWSAPKSKKLEYRVVKIPVKDESKDSNRLVFDKPVVSKFSINADRLVPSQPIQFEDFHTNIRARFNLRKLFLLPYHLVEANMLQELFDHVFFNLEWIHSKILAFDLPHLIYDYELYKNNYEVNLVGNALKMAESAINEDTNLLFNELTGRLLPFYKHYEFIRKLIDQCDRKTFKLNPLIPINQLSNAPSWVIQENINMGVDLDDSDLNLQVDLLEGNHNGNILILKQNQSEKTKFYDLDLCEPLSDVHTGKGMVYCSKNGEYVCTIELLGSYNLVIRRIETGELHGVIDIDQQYSMMELNTDQDSDYLKAAISIANIYLSATYALIILSKAKSPIVIDLSLAKVVKVLPYKPAFCCISPDERVLIIYCENHLYYYDLKTFNRLIVMELYDDLPGVAQFMNDNKQLLILTKHKKLVISFRLNLEKRIYKKEIIFQQDFDLHDMRFAFNGAVDRRSPSGTRNYLLASSVYNIYVFSSTCITSSTSTLSSKEDEVEFKLIYKIDSRILDSDQPNVEQVLSSHRLGSEHEKSRRTRSTASAPISRATRITTGLSSAVSTKLATPCAQKFTGFGILSNKTNQYIYATLDKYLIIYDIQTGKKLRIFQSNHLNDNTILKTYSSVKLNNFTGSGQKSDEDGFERAENENKLISLLSNGTILLWNLNNLNLALNYNENMNVFNYKLIDCLLPRTSYKSALNEHNFISYCDRSPFAKTFNLRKNQSEFIDCFTSEGLSSSSSSNLSVSTASFLDDNLNSCQISSITIDDNSKYCFIVYDIDDFKGKRLPHDSNFIKKLCFLLELTHRSSPTALNQSFASNSCSVIEKFSFIVNKNSRFELNARFVNQAPKGKESEEEVFLLVKSTLCLNDFDPFMKGNLDWTEFETSVRLYGPIGPPNSQLNVANEFKLVGESLLNRKQDPLIQCSGVVLYSELMHECHKLFEKEHGKITDKIKATRYDVHLNVMNLFDPKNHSKTNLFSLKELLDNNDFEAKDVSNPILIDIQVVYQRKYLLLIYSKDGACDPNKQKNLASASGKGFNALTSNKYLLQYEYDYGNMKFMRNINTNKGAILFDPVRNEVVKKFSSIFQAQTNVEELICSGSIYIMDNYWFVYELVNGRLVYNIRNLDLYRQDLPADRWNYFSQRFARFLFEGKYLLTTSQDFRRLYIIRCIDSHMVASFKLDETTPDDTIYSMQVGELDRTIMLGTSNGNLLLLKLLVDLEQNEAFVDYIHYYRTQSVHSPASKKEASQTSISVAPLSLVDTDALLEKDYKKLYEINLQKALINVNSIRQANFKHPPASSYGASSSNRLCNSSYVSSSKRPKTSALTSQTSAKESSSKRPLTSESTNSSASSLASSALSTADPEAYELFKALSFSVSDQQTIKHLGIAKRNLTNVSNGIKHSHLYAGYASNDATSRSGVSYDETNNRVRTKACIIQ